MLEGHLRSLNRHNAILYDIFKRGKVERANFHAFSSHFLKENPFSGGSCVGAVGVFGPKGVFGCQEHGKKFQKVCSLIGDLLRVTVLTTHSNLLSGNGATRIYSIAKPPGHKTS